MSKGKKREIKVKEAVPCLNKVPSWELLLEARYLSEVIKTILS